MFYLEKNRLGFHWLHVDVVTVNLDAISGQGGPDPHGLGLLEEADHHLEQDLRVATHLRESHMAWGREGLVSLIRVRKLNCNLVHKV